MNPQERLLELQEVSQTYGSGDKRFTAVEDISLAMGEGQFVALLGPSGSGKSTLLRIITGLQKPSSGRVLYRGQPLQGVNPHASIVFQNFALFPWLNVQENVELPLKANGVPAAERTAHALDLIDRVGLDGFESAYPRELSGGMRQKVGFARAMAIEPELLCLDEPFSALDALSAESLRGELMELWLSGEIPTKAILMVTHNIEEAALMADRIVVMDKNPGRIIADFPVLLPQPRERKSPQFQTLVDRVYGLLAGQTQPEAVELGSAPGGPGAVRRLPNVVISDLAGMLEYLSQVDRADIYRLADDLSVDSDYLLRLTDAAELLSFATIQMGDIAITPLGETFAEASILARKEIFATRIRRLPIFVWLLSRLEQEEDHHLQRDEVLETLEDDFPPEEAGDQFDLIVDWGRYAELLGYDDDDEQIYLEVPESQPAAGPSLG